MNYILVGKHGRPSLRAVSDAMKTEHTILMRRKYKKTEDIRWYMLSGIGENYKWVEYLGINDIPHFNEDDVVIRWGYSGTIIGSPRVYQEAKAIDIISNKGKARIVMDKAGVPVPKTSTNEHPQDVGYPYIFRPMKHSRGKNFFVINNLKEEQELIKLGYNKTNGYLSEIYDKKEEIRVYVAHGKVLMIRDKGYNPDNGIAGNRALTHDEWRVIPLDEYKRYRTACKIACDAVKAVGGHTGGVDVMINRDNKEMPCCVCEINSAPTIKSSEYGVSRYAKYFDWLFRKKRFWWKYKHPVTGEVRDYPEKGKSFWFTNQQLED